MGESTNRVTEERTLEARDEYEIGLALFRKKQWKTAARHFRLAEERSPRNDNQANLYRSYYGLSLIYSADVSGLNLCRNAAGRENKQPDVYLNLALAELRLNHRKRACSAITRGLRINPGHPGLLKVRKKIGMRRPPCLPFLGRDNPLNKWLGKATFRRARHGDGGN